MVVGGSRQETLNPGFVLLGTRQQGVPIILMELFLPEGFDPVSTAKEHQFPQDYRTVIDQSLVSICASCVDGLDTEGCINANIKLINYNIYLFIDFNT
ncbi:unnamed protein product [Schistosoma margrebowiei]|uniref:Uncharacterized protein n=1 Tax=Schistosoma margrebowiei TaxID=48269 RepID=A0A183MRW8_9TREM|nr:unnamed protein product [Schistosoma margrebowiei]